MTHLFLDCSPNYQFFFSFYFGRIKNFKYVYYLNLYLIVDYFIQFNTMDMGLFSINPAKRLSILGLPAYFFQLLLFLIPSVVILFLSPCFHYRWRRGLFRLWNHNINVLGNCFFLYFYNYSPAIPIVFSSWRPSQRTVFLIQNVKGANNLFRGFIRKMFDIEIQQE